MSGTSRKRGRDAVEGSQSAQTSCRSSKQQYRERNKIHARNSRKRKQEKMVSLKECAARLEHDRDILWKRIISMGIQPYQSLAEWRETNQLRPPHVRSEAEIGREISVIFSEEVDRVPAESSARTEEEKKAICYSRERNRIHAKKSRYRRKLLHEDLVSTVEFLNTETSRMKEQLNQHCSLYGIKAADGDQDLAAILNGDNKEMTPTSDPSNDTNSISSVKNDDMANKNMLSMLAQTALYSLPEPEWVSAAEKQYCITYEPERPFSLAYSSENVEKYVEHQVEV